jgi:hypothetical protein
MSLYSSLSKSYSTVGSGIPRLGGAVSGAGAVVLASALNGGATSAGTLGKIIAGASTKAGLDNSGVSRGLVAPSSIAAAPASVAPATSGFGKFLSSPVGQFATSSLSGGLIAGVGAGIGSWLQAREAKKQQQAVTDSYKVGSNAMHGQDVPSGGQPAPAQKWQRPVYVATPDGKIERQVS